MKETGHVAGAMEQLHNFRLNQEAQMASYVVSAIARGREDLAVGHHKAGSVHVLRAHGPAVAVARLLPHSRLPHATPQTSSV